MSSPEHKDLKGPELLSHYQDNWQTDMGAAIIGKERVVLRGRDLLSEFRDHRWMELMVFAIMGKESPKIARLIEAMWVISTSFPDPRLWNNRVAALGGTAQSTGALSVCAASAVSEASAYGLRTSKGAIDLFYRFKKQLDDGAELETLIKRELKKYRAVWGFGRPLVSKDERVEPLMTFAKSIGCGEGPFIKLAFDIAEYLSCSRYGFQINISAVCAALLADEGVSVEDFYYFASLSFVGGILPCYIDALNHPKGTFFPLSTEIVNYDGKYENRLWHTTGKQ